MRIEPVVRIGLLCPDCGEIVPMVLPTRPDGRPVFGAHSEFLLGKHVEARPAAHPTLAVPIEPPGPLDDDVALLCLHRVRLDDLDGVQVGQDVCLLTDDHQGDHHLTRFGGEL